MYFVYFVFCCFTVQVCCTVLLIVLVFIIFNCLLCDVMWCDVMLSVDVDWRRCCFVLGVDTHLFLPSPTVLPSNEIACRWGIPVVEGVEYWTSWIWKKNENQENSHPPARAIHFQTASPKIEMSWIDESSIQLKYLSWIESHELNRFSSWDSMTGQVRRYCLKGKT